MCFHFSSSNTNCIKFISNYILQNSENENYKYIFIIHINRNFNKENNERRFLSDINPDIYQIFIDNLNGNNQIKLNDLLNKRINNLLDEFKDEQKFENNLNNFINKKIENNILKKEIEKNVLIQDIIPKLFKDNYINNHTIDIVSCIIEYIKDKVFIEQTNIKSELSRCLFKFKKQNEIESIGFFCKTPFPDNLHLLPVLIIKCNKLILNELENDEFLKIKPLEKNKEISITLFLIDIYFFLSWVIQNSQ